MKEMDETTIKRSDLCRLPRIVKEEAGELIHVVEQTLSVGRRSRRTRRLFGQEYLRKDDDVTNFYKDVGVGYFDLNVAGGVMRIFAE